MVNKKVNSDIIEPTKLMVIPFSLPLNPLKGTLKSDISVLICTLIPEAKPGTTYFVCTRTSIITGKWSEGHLALSCCLCASPDSGRSTR